MFFPLPPCSRGSSVIAGGETHSAKVTKVCKGIVEGANLVTAMPNDLHGVPDMAVVFDHFTSYGSPLANTCSDSLCLGGNGGG